MDKANVPGGSSLDVAGFSGELVGRRAEVSWLIDRLDEAVRGAPQVVVLRGEAGIGKSRLARHLVKTASDRGIPTSIARFREQPGPPLQALRDDFLPRLAVPGLDDSRNGHDDGEPQLLAAVRSSFGARIARGPFVLFVDDVQWADATSRNWLVNLARLAADLALQAPAYLLMIVVVRDTPGVTEIPQLALLRREQITTSLTLHGLSELDVGRMAKVRGVGDLPLATIREITYVTRGNPLFVSALLTQYRESITRGEPVESSPRRRLPDEMQDLLMGRVASLSTECQQMLTVAALLSGSWDVAQLAAVTGSTPANLGPLLDEAERADVVAGDGTYDFTHPLFERAVLSSITHREWRETHARIAAVLIDGSAEMRTSDMAIAHHLYDAGDLADPATVLRYGPRAAEAAEAEFAWDAAARYYEGALAARRRVHDDPEWSEAELALRASVARLENDEPFPALRLAEEALDALHDPSPVMEAKVHCARLRAALFTSAPGDTVEFGAVEALAPRLERSEPAVAALTYSVLASAYTSAARDADRARWACRKAIELGNASGAHDACARAWGQLGVAQWMSLEVADAVVSLEEEHAHAVLSGDNARLGHSRALLPMALVWLGRFDEAEAAIAAARSTTRAVGYHRYEGFVLLAQALLCAARGMFDEAVEAVDAGVEVGRLTGYPGATPLLLPVTGALRSMRGDVEGTEELLAQWAPPGALPHRVAFESLLRLRLAIACGEEPEVADLPVIWQQLATPARPGSDAAAALVIEIAAHAGRADLCDGPAKFLDDMYQRGQTVTTTTGAFIPRALGIAAAAAGDTGRARSLLEGNLQLAVDQQAHAEVAATEAALAAVLLRTPDPSGASELLESARRMARALGFGPLEAQCNALAVEAGLLRAQQPAANVGAVDDLGRVGMSVQGAETAIIFFCDIADSTALTEAWGDWVFHDRSFQLLSALRSAILGHAGMPVEGIKLGDGVLAEFRSAQRALDCAMHCRSLSDDAGLPLHIGLHAGDVIRRDGDIFGGAVNIAARVCSEAEAGQVLVSQTIRELARTSGSHRFVDAGVRPLKGIAEPLTLYSVEIAP
jgi:class 3 adenylate cyclase